MYTIAPVDQVDRPRQVHRSLLKGLVGSVTADHSDGHPLSGEAAQLSQAELSSEEDLVLSEQRAGPTRGPPLAQAIETGRAERQPRVDRVDVDPAHHPLVVEDSPASALSQGPSTRPEVIASSAIDLPRRSSRATTGQHSNPHRLPTGF